MAAGDNRFNRISSKEWLPFQKSWFVFDSKEWIRSNFRFFSTKEPSELPILYYGNNFGDAETQGDELGFKIVKELDGADPIQFAMIDLRAEIEELVPDEWPAFRAIWIDRIRSIADRLVHRRFLLCAMPNAEKGDSFYPYAWEMGGALGQILSLKDEKIACIPDPTIEGKPSLGSGIFYCLYFRKDELSGKHQSTFHQFEPGVSSFPLSAAESVVPKWFILRPQRRKKKEILHPAKFPEDLPDLFISRYTTPNNNVFDPMSGTGSTQLAAVARGRNGYGTELSSFFAEIARERSLTYLFELVKNQAELSKVPEVDIIEGDARKVAQYGFPKQHLVFTSPPYWDMLNMKGAENQAKRLEKGLKTNYSEDTEDLGNQSDYHSFIDELCGIYRNTAELMAPEALLVVVVKNIKKKGSNYPFAWDLAAALQPYFKLLPEVFWCQDDISIAPYGYGNTFVSNTFHQYCLVFKKRL